MIAVTGIGAISALGDSPDELFARLCAGETALRAVEGFPAKGPAAALSLRTTSTDLALRVARQAMPSVLPDTAVIGASTAGDMCVGEKAFARRLAGEALEEPSELLFAQLCHQPARAVAAAIEAPLTFTLSTACTSGLCAIGAAADLVRTGVVPRALALGADALCDITLAGFGTLGVYAPEPCRPFDVDRQGMNIGEGAAALLLEDLSAARARNAPILAILEGYADTSDAHHLSAPQPEGEGAVRAIRAVLSTPVQYVNAHATATQLNDAMEAKALAAAVPGAAVSGSKGGFGHTLGAAGALEAVVAIQALRQQRMPPTVGCRTPESELDIVLSARDSKIDAALTVNFAFGGNNAAALFRGA